MGTVESEAGLAEQVAAATGPLAIRGGGTRGMAVPGEKLSTAGLSGVTLYEPGALTLVAAAGTPVARIEALLAGEHQQLAFEPMDHRGLLRCSGEPTIGGVVAGNVSGPRRVQAGACRDHLLGVRFVDGTGTVIRNGGRVMKNVTGYDLVKLMAGSWGTLGVLTEVALKVLPQSETQATLHLRVDGSAQAVQVMSQALGSPFELTGAAYDPAQSEVLLRVEGFADSVEYRSARLADRLRELGTVERLSGAAQSAEAWQAIRDVRCFHDRQGEVWRLSVKPGDAPDIARRLNTDALLFDWGGGLIWTCVPEGTDLRRRLGGFGGHATLVRASAETRARLGTFQPQPPALEAISAGLRARFDPRGLFNRGLMSPAQPVGG